MANLYPNLSAEMSRKQLDYGTLYKSVADFTGKTTDTVSNWFTGRAGALPTRVAFYVRDEFFPNLYVDYLFDNEPIEPVTPRN